jgi:hypothetical protein
LLLACASEEVRHLDAEPDEVASLEEELYGSVVYEGCSGDEKVQLDAATTYLRDNLGWDYQMCLESSYAIEHRWKSPEAIYAASTSARSVRYTCTDSCDCGEFFCTDTPCADTVAAYATGFDVLGRERVFVMHRTLATGLTAGRLGGILLHEILHDHSFQHLHGYGIDTVPDLAEECAVHQRALHATRSLLADEAPLAHIGGGGGGEQSLRCGHEEMVTGVVGSTGPYVTSFGLRCHKEKNGGLLDAHLLATTAPSGSTPFGMNCGEREVLVGLWGYANAYVNAIQPVCESLDRLETNAGRFIGILGTEVGTRDGTWFSRLCPNDKAVVGMRISTGSRVDRIQLLCDDVRHLMDRTQTPRGSAGLASGPAFHQDCEGSGVMTGLYGSYSALGQLLSVGSFCQPMTGEHADFGRRSWYALGPSGGSPAGVNGEDAWRKRCQDGEVMVGLRTVVGDITVAGWTVAKGVVLTSAPLCVNYKRWLSGEQSPQTAMYELDIARRGTEKDLLCAGRETVVAITGRGSSAINEVGIVCAEPEGAVPSNFAGTVGSWRDGGHPFFARCPLGGAMTGLEIGVDGTTVRAVRGMCARPAGTELHQRFAYATPTMGSRGVPLTEDTCRTGEALVGIEAAGPGSYGRVAAICQPWSEVRAGTSTGKTRHAGVGTGAGTVYSRECSLGQAVVALEGKDTVSEFDSLTIWCARPDLIVGDTAFGRLGATGKDALYRVHLPSDLYGKRVRITLEGVRYADFDLYVRRGLVPDTTHYDSARTTTAPGGVEAAFLYAPERDFYYVLVRSKQGADTFQLRISAEDYTFLLPPIKVSLTPL